MADRFRCLDTSVVVKYLIDEEGSAEAMRLVTEAVLGDQNLIAPAWAWAEVGSVLRRRVHRGALTALDAARLWRLYVDLPIVYLDDEAIRERAWRIAATRELDTGYDAAFLACVEEVRSIGARAELWTADRVFLRRLGPRRPAYVRELGA